MTETKGTRLDENTSLSALIDRYFAPRPAKVEFEFGAISHTGRVRDENQDHYLVTRRRKEQTVLKSNLPKNFQDNSSDDAYMLAVADGMGGPDFGKLASMLALRVGMSLGPDEIKWSMNVNEQEANEIVEKIGVFMRLMDREIIYQGELRKEMFGMGTTLTVAYTVGVNAFIAHVGDSRAYLMRDNQLTQLTSDHTLANQMRDAGMITEDTEHFRRTNHILINCLGGPEEGVEVETRHLRIKNNDRLVLCSDGLSDMVSQDDIQQILNAEPDCQLVTRRLVDRALNAGGRDNITVVVARYGVPD